MSDESESPLPERSKFDLRKAARDVALQTVYCLDTPGVEFDEALQDGLNREAFSPELIHYIEHLVTSVRDRLEEWDAMIAPLLAKGWDLKRISKVDRAILRMAAAELETLPQISPKVTINEAVNQAKEFGDKESARFVNGLLGRLLTQSSKAQWTPGSVPAEEMILAPAVVELEPETELIAEGSAAHEEVKKVGGWVVKVEESPEAP